MTDNIGDIGDQVIEFIETFVPVPEGDLIGDNMELLPFQKKFIRAIYQPGIRRGYLSIARKNGKTALISAIVLAHLIGPVAVRNSRILCGALSVDQANMVFDFMVRMINQSPVLSGRVQVYTGNHKRILGIAMGTEFRTIASEAKTAHGRSASVVVLDEAGQVRGSNSEFFEAMVTSQAAYTDSKLFVISTQAADDNDLFSLGLDDAAESGDKSIVSHVYSADPDCDIEDREQWRKANPAIGIFRSEKEFEDLARQTVRMPSNESHFRWLYLNQRVEHLDPFLTGKVFAACSEEPIDFEDRIWYGGLDLSTAKDLTAYVRVGWVGGKLQVFCRFWIPADNLIARSKRDRVPYDRWVNEGLIEATPGPVVDYRVVAQTVVDDIRNGLIRKVAFDRWNISRFQSEMINVGASNYDLQFMEPFGQGYQSMSPALNDLESRFLKCEICHGGNPVLEQNFKNAVVQRDPAGNRKLVKVSDDRRIDGAISLAMATKIAGEDKVGKSIFDDPSVVASVGLSPEKYIGLEA